jgi:hypothetical protein
LAVAVLAVVEQHWCRPVVVHQYLQVLLPLVVVLVTAQIQVELLLVQALVDLTAVIFQVELQHFQLVKAIMVAFLTLLPVVVLVVVVAVVVLAQLALTVVVAQAVKAVLVLTSPLMALAPITVQAVVEVVQSLALVLLVVLLVTLVLQALERVPMRQLVEQHQEAMAVAVVEVA